MSGKLLNLNDLVYFAKVVECKGFAPAARMLHVSRSVVSTRIKALEEHLGVRLLQRTTRRFAITDAGERIFRHSQDIMTTAQRVHEEAGSMRTEVRGNVRVASAVLLAETLLAPLIAEFMHQHPEINIELFATDRLVDLIRENIDMTLRVRVSVDTDAEMIVRRFGVSHRLLVASPAYFDDRSRPKTPEDLATLDILGFDEGGPPLHTWVLRKSATNKEAFVRHTPRFVSANLLVLMTLAESGLGVALLPESLCGPAIREGRLEVVMPSWQGEEGIVHAIFPSRQGMRPAVRVWIDFLAKELPKSLASAVPASERPRSGRKA
ncbi:LysR family transcriptional regulator [Burkholderia metallica]|uniref:LysR family transcriptional regulator n=1 Tax=Burkholderia metallica TaxID=488729 RepID=UPI00157B336B|nr:LysR family transcriptional regulator [Burkholderia metallica]NTZ88991.1 LysR family transcriptional regulator [Burkholderia metallica]